MALVEGFGDEVTQTLGILFIIMLIVLLWISTHVPEIRRIHGIVIILDRGIERQHHGTPTVTPAPYTYFPTIHDAPISPILARNEPPPTNEIVSINDNSQNSTSSNELQEINENCSATENDESETGSSIGFDESFQSTSSVSTENELQACEDSITIQLKYFNDSYRLVDGRLQENIGVFKRRHFSTELSCNKIICLIFEGKVLHNDSLSLRNYRLFDNCVVYCLIQDPHPTANAQQIQDDQDANDQPLLNMVRQSQPLAAPLHMDWNLAIMFSTSITIILSLLWYICIQSNITIPSSCRLGVLTFLNIISTSPYFILEYEE